VIANIERIIVMIKRIIKIMVNTYNITTIEDLTGIKSFVQAEELIQIQSDITAFTSI
jgi:hypothetical protein